MTNEVMNCRFDNEMSQEEFEERKESFLKSFEEINADIKPED